MAQRTIAFAFSAVYTYIKLNITNPIIVINVVFMVIFLCLVLCFTPKTPPYGLSSYYGLHRITGETGVLNILEISLIGPMRNILY